MLQWLIGSSSCGDESGHGKNSVDFVEVYVCLLSYSNIVPKSELKLQSQ